MRRCLTRRADALAEKNPRPSEAWTGHPRESNERDRVGHPSRHLRLRVSRPTLSATNAEKDGAPSSPLFDQLRMLAGAGGLGFLHQAAGVGDEVGYFEGFRQAGHAFVLKETAHVGLGYAREGE
jgi:hypothetical protein